MDVALARGAGGFTHRAKALERPCLCKLRRSQPIDEVAAPDPARLLERPEHRVHRREATLDALGCHRVARHYTVPVEEREAEGMEALGGGRP